jgi:hypothetical protein
MNLKTKAGTDYYVNLEENEVFRLIHIGKSSYHLRFAFHWQPDHYKTFESFQLFLQAHQIYNHFGHRVDSGFLLSAIQSKRDDPSIIHECKKAGGKKKMHLIKEKKKNKAIAEHHFIDENFGMDTDNVSINIKHEQKKKDRNPKGLP